MSGLGWAALLLLTAALAFAQPPQITSAGVVSAASYAQPVTPGSLVSIFGTNLAAETIAATTQPFPAQLGGTSVTVNGISAPLLFVSPTQINLEVPAATQICYGCADFPTLPFVVTTASGLSSPAQVPISLAAPGVFTDDKSGCGQAAALNVAADGSSSLNSPSNSASPGDYVAIYGTGYGLVYSPPPDGASDPNAQHLEQELGVTLGFNTPLVPFINPNYEGLAPGLVGVDQVNFQIPTWAQQGCSVPVVLNGDVAGPTVTLSIHTGGGQCVIPPVQSYGQIALMKTIASGTSADGETDTLTAIFPSGPGLPPPQPLAAAPSDGYVAFSTSLPNVVSSPGPSRTCAVTSYNDLSGGPVAISSPTTSLTVQPISQVGGVAYQKTLPTGFIAPGVYRVAASGGSVQLQSSFTVGSPIQLDTAPLAAGTVVSSSGSITINWTGGQPGTLVTMTIVEGTGLQAVGDYAQADASTGSLTIGPYCVGNPVSAGGNGVVCTLGALPVINPLEVIVDVTPYPAQVASFAATGLTGPVQATWDYRYVFGGLILGQ